MYRCHEHAILPGPALHCTISPADETGTGKVKGSSNNVYVLFSISLESFVACRMVTASQNVAVNGEGRPKKRLVLNAFVEMCMSSRWTQESNTHVYSTFS
jgi:hypothetical protein